MKYIILADGTRIENLRDDTTVNHIFAVRNSYEEAAAVRKLFTKENSEVIRIYFDEEHEVNHGAGLILLDGCSIIEDKSENVFVCQIETRNKDMLDIIQDQLSEIQDVILELIGG